MLTLVAKSESAVTMTACKVSKLKKGIMNAQRPLRDFQRVNCQYPFIAYFTKWHWRYIGTSWAKFWLIVIKLKPEWWMSQWCSWAGLHQSWRSAHERECCGIPHSVNAKWKLLPVSHGKFGSCVELTPAIADGVLMAFAIIHSWPRSAIVKALQCCVAVDNCLHWN